MENISRIYREYRDREPIKIEELPSSGSNRRYFRITEIDGTLIAAMGSSIEENRAFWAIAEHFSAQGLNVPKVLYHSSDFKYYLQQDLGDMTLFKAVEDGREKGNYSEREKELLKKTISMLPDIQFKGADGLDFSVCFPQPEFDSRMVSFDLNYFKYCFLMATGLTFSEIRLDEDFKKLCEVLLKSSSPNFLYRDFQARNVMLVGGEPYFIDFQGGRKGPIYYDVASFIWQAKANYSEELRVELIEAYLDSLSKFIPVDRDYFHYQLRHFILFRTLQVLGAYGFRGYFEKKPHFLQSVPFAIDNLRYLLREPFAEYPYLSDILHELTTLRQFSEMNANKKLEVRINSFAYKKGIPDDPSGNGGGYVFDCRAINNPGKYDHFRHFTGLDKEVVDYLEEDGGVLEFLDNIYVLADRHVERYIERKFSNLMFNFGCTGGQHRSVYCAERVAERLAKKYDIKIYLYHREQEIEKTFN